MEPTWPARRPKRMFADTDAIRALGGANTTYADDLAGVPSSAAVYSATLLSASPPGARRDVYLIQAEPGDPRRSDPHHAGTTEHVVLISGQAQIGPAGDPVLLNPGDYLSYAGDAQHVFEAMVPGTSAVHISELR